MDASELNIDSANSSMHSLDSSISNVTIIKRPNETSSRKLDESLSLCRQKFEHVIAKMANLKAHNESLNQKVVTIKNMVDCYN